MEAFLDRVWEYIAATMQMAGNMMYSILEPLHWIGPLALIFMLALFTVACTKLLNRLIVTRRYIELEKEYHHWYGVRQEAMSCEDREKGKQLARNIDQAELNRAYYDYFFEGLLLGMARKVIPIFFVFAFINEFYRPERLLTIFGREYVFSFGGGNGEPILVGAVFWYFVSLLAGYLLFAVGQRIVKSLRAKAGEAIGGSGEKVAC